MAGQEQGKDHGMAWHGWAGLGKSGARIMARLGMARRGESRARNMAWLGLAWRGRAWQEQGKEHGLPEFLRRRLSTKESTHGT